jgi:hypothetical protein
VSAGRTVLTREMPAKNYEDEDDCLAAAEQDVAAHEGVEDWQCVARWGTDERQTIIVEVRL